MTRKVARVCLQLLVVLCIMGGWVAVNYKNFNFNLFTARSSTEYAEPAPAPAPAPAPNFEDYMLKQKEKPEPVVIVIQNNDVKPWYEATWINTILAGIIGALSQVLINKYLPKERK